MGWQRLIRVVASIGSAEALSVRPALSAAERERLLGRLPEAARKPLQSVYVHGNGQGNGAWCGLLSGLYWRSLGEVVRNWEVAQELDAEIKDMVPSVPCSPLDAILPVMYSDGWISIAHDYGNLEVGIDVTPGPAGVVGQVINWGPEYEDHFVLAPDLDGLAAQLASEFDAGNYLMEEEDGAASVPRLLSASANVSPLLHVVGSSAVEPPPRGLP